MESKQFFIKSGNDSFKSKQKSIFDLIANEEKSVKLSNDEIEQMEVTCTSERSERKQAKRNRKETRALRGQESLFKSPGAPPPRKRFIPDFQRNPQRWTKYTLADVPASDMSEASNTAAALSFLRSRKRSPEPPPCDEKLRFTSRNQRSLRPRVSDDGEVDQFRAHPIPSVGLGDPCEPIEETSPPEKPSFVNGKLTMPEYVVGEKPTKKRSTNAKARPAGKELKLSHLDEYDDE